MTTRTLDKKLYLACEEGDVASALSLLLRGAAADAQTQSRNIEQMFIRNARPLYAASERGHGALVALLLAHGAQPDLLHDDGSSALVIASRHGHTRCVAELLSAGASVDNFRDRHADLKRGSALFAACFAGHSAIVTLLLSRGASVAPGGAGSPFLPLAAACASYRGSIVAQLLAASPEAAQIADHAGHLPRLENTPLTWTSVAAVAALAASRRRLLATASWRRVRL